VCENRSCRDKTRNVTLESMRVSHTGFEIVIFGRDFRKKSWSVLKSEDILLSRKLVAAFVTSKLQLDVDEDLKLV